MEVEELKDDEDELAALMTASTTVRKRKLEVGPTINPKRRKQLKDLAILESGDNACQREREQNFAASYYNKLKEQLDEATLAKVIKLLTNFDGSSEGVIDLFKDMSSVLPTSLAEDFLCFLTPAQAHLCGKFMDHLVLSKIIDFFRKFEISFAKQPQMLRKFYDILCQLSSSENISLQQVRDAVLPLLKSKSFLMEYFLQLFPAEKPSETVVLDDFEDIYLDGDCVSEEEIRLVDTDDSASCPCSCHPKHPTHCQRCSVKYINGRVYIQTGRSLRSARVEFNGSNPMEALRRICVNSEELTPKAKPNRRKPDILNHKDQSPIKHVSSPHMAATESEDESLELKANTPTAKPKSARSLKLRFKSSEKLTTKAKNSKMHEVSEEMRIMTDENAITDTPDCFLAKRLSPVENADSTVIGNNTNFNNFLSENQNDHSRRVNHESTLNFAVHSPLKKASICLDSLDSTSESIQSPIKIDQCLHIPLKRIDDDDELLMTLNNKSVLSSDSHNPTSQLGNSCCQKYKTENFRPETSMSSSISGNIDSIFSSSVVDEMNLLLGSSSLVKVEPNHSELIKSTQNSREKFSEPTIDSLSIDSFLNISNLDAKIDSFLTNAEATKNLDALLNDSSPESSNLDKNSYLNGTGIKEESESQLMRSNKDISGSSNGISEEARSEISLTMLDRPTLKVDHNMDSILNLVAQDLPKKENPSSSHLRDFPEKLSNANILSIESLSASNEELQRRTQRQDSQPSLKIENESKENKEAKDSIENLEVSSVQMICDCPKFKEKEINGSGNNSILTFEGPAQVVEESKVDLNVRDHLDSLPEYKSVPTSLVENLTVIDAVQSVSFICGEEGDESGKVTLFSAEPIEEKILQDDAVISFPVEIAKEEFSNGKQIETSFMDSSGKIGISCGSSFSPLRDIQTCNDSSLNFLKDEPESDNLVSVNFSTSPSNEAVKNGESSVSNSIDPSKDSKKSEESLLSDSTASALKDEPNNEKLVPDGSSLAPRKFSQMDENLISSDSPPSFSKDPHIDATRSSEPAKDSKKSEESALSENQYQLAKEQPESNDRTEDTNADVENKLKDQGNDWTMEEDKIILQTFQKNPDMQDIFSKIKTQLPERSLLEVQSRFYVLIELLEKMSHTSDDASKKE